MLKFFFHLIIIIKFLSLSCFSEEVLNSNNNIKIIFGSCSNQNISMPHWEYINSYQPNYLFLLGDNVYGDFNDVEAKSLLAAYSKLNKNRYFLNLKSNTQIHPIWDDHDYGINDGGKNWPYKKRAQSIFLDFFNINKNEIRRKREGIYHSSNINNKIKIKIIALDTRYFKDEFKKNYNYNIKKKYLPDYDISKTILGKKQWRWFEEQLKEEYDLLLILSSIQVIPTEHGWEKWFNFPNERNKLLNLINDNKKLTIILSGDRHVGAMYKYNDNTFEITSSSFNQKIFKFSEQDKYSLGNIVNENNFGFMKINMSKRELEVELRTGFINEKKVFKKLKVKF